MIKELVVFSSSLVSLGVMFADAPEVKTCLAGCNTDISSIGRMVQDTLTVADRESASAVEQMITNEKIAKLNFVLIFALNLIARFSN